MKTSLSEEAMMFAIRELRMGGVGGPGIAIDDGGPV
jgi:hypothetical protein